MALLAKLRPCGAWRVGADSGDRLRVGRVLHSDALYSALTHAFIELGELDAWLDATALHSDGAQVRLSSCFPFTATESGDALFLPPPETHWPPPDSLRIRWKSARFATPNAVWQLLSGKPLIEEHWVVDGVSECLLPVLRNVPAASPFRVTVRSRAAVDRLGQGVEPHQTACLEFSKGAGIWMAFQFANKDAEAHWAPLLKGALKLIADSGLGGERSSGWGRFEQPEFSDGELGVLLFGQRYRSPEEVTGHWLLSLFSPAADDRVDWQQGNYRVVTRTGRVESAAGWGAPKRANQMIAEGGVLVAPVAPKGTARDVAPIGFPHPVYRAGFALTLPVGKAKPQPSRPVVVDKTLLAALSKPEVTVNDLLAEELAASEAEPTVVVPDVVEQHEEPAHGTPDEEPTHVATETATPIAPTEPVAESDEPSTIVVEHSDAPDETATPVLASESVPAAAVKHDEEVPASTAPLLLPEPEPHAELLPATIHPPAGPHSHAPLELPAAQLEFSLEPAADSPVVPEHTSPDPKKEAE